MRFRELDGLRGIAAMAVVLYHFTGHYNTYYPQDPLPKVDIWWGAFGVQLFFLISGFVILMSAEAAQRPSDFVISRVTRLYPVYWIVLILGVMIAAVFAVPNVPHSPDIVAMNVTMVQRWFLVPNVLDVFWTLAVEMQFYVLLFMLLVITRCSLSERLMVRVVLTWLGVSLVVAVWAFPAAHGVTPQEVPTPVKLILNVTLASYGPLFCTGMISFLSRRAHRVHWLLWPSAVVAVVVTGLTQEWEDAAVVAVICLAFIIVTSREATPALLLPPLQWLGKVSYSLYLVHSIAGFVVIHSLWPYLGREGAVIVALAVVLVIAWALWAFGERRLSRHMRSLLTRLRDRRSRSEDASSAAHGR
ncbi:acyltransferase [Microbacterium sp. NPDC089321]|uniref:acyltransferase family protein n=1 Tax=Microbacterium sp. NPDC089321 TaxID=3155183 RepID=UPI003438E42B